MFQFCMQDVCCWSVRHACIVRYISMICAVMKLADQILPQSYLVMHHTVNFSYEFITLTCIESVCTINYNGRIS